MGLTTRIPAAFGAAEWFPLWQARRAELRAALKRRIARHLERGGTVEEQPIGIRWSMERGTSHSHYGGPFGAWDGPPFIPEYWTADYVSGHLVNRALGFGWSVRCI